MPNPMPNPAKRRDRPLSDEERDQVRVLYAEGCGRNEISRRTGIHQRRVSAIAAELGLTFRRAAHTAVATEIKKEDARARRAALAISLLEDAERLRQQLFAACTAYNFGGKDNTFAQVKLSEPSFRDKNYLMGAIGLAVDRAVRLDEYDKDTGLGDAKSMLSALAAGLDAAYRELEGQPSDGQAPADATGP